VADVGARLRASREAKRLSLDTVAATTRVQSRILSAIEKNDPAALPPRPYGRGFVRAYARELGLNPDETVRDYFGQFAPPDPPAPPPQPQRAAPVFDLQAVVDRLPIRYVAAVLVAILVVAGAWMLARRSPGPATAPQDAVGTSGRVAPQPRAVDARPTPPPSSAALSVLLSASAPCWVAATVDGKRVLYRALQPGEHASLDGNRTISIRAGNAGVLAWSVNGRDMGAFGSPGEVRTSRVTPDGITIVESSARD
jgi:transcriptional regulator with XRE-family HTH domain